MPCGTYLRSMRVCQFHHSGTSTKTAESEKHLHKSPLVPSRERLHGPIARLASIHCIANQFDARVKGLGAKLGKGLGFMGERGQGRI